MICQSIAWKRICLGVILAAFTLAANATVGRAQIPVFNPEVKWRTDYNQARREAQEKGLPLVIDFGTRSCRYCVLLDQTTFRDPKVISTMNDRFIPLKIDAEIEIELSSALHISSFPTIVLAGPDGKILNTIVGYKDSGDFLENLQRVLASIANPEWMQRDLQMATKWMQSGNYAQAISALKPIIDDGKGRPIQASAEKLMGELELKAAERLSIAKNLHEKGQSTEALETLTETVRIFPGLQASKDASDLMGKLVQSPEMRNQQRSKRARELLAQARDFYKNREYIPCMDRCEILVGAFGDLAEGQEGSLLVNEIKNNPEWLQNAAETMSERLASLYLALADALMKKAQPQLAEMYLQRILQAFPGSRHAEMAQIRLSQLQGLPLRRTDIQRAGAP